jgi:hypothetical protein
MFRIASSAGIQNDRANERGFFHFKTSKLSCSLAEFAHSGFTGYAKDLRAFACLREGMESNAMKTAGIQ